METKKKIVIIGPESTGKSTLCSQLAEHYKTKWVAEYAREYLLQNGTEYTYDDLLTIAKGQIVLEGRYLKKIPFKNQQSKIFIDTNMYVMKVWCEYVFNKCHTWILNRIAERKYDYYLLCAPDLDWVSDALREYPDKRIREKLFNYYKDLLINQPLPWIEIKGSYNERFEKAINFIDSIEQIPG